jgi:hypothetical protein
MCGLQYFMSFPAAWRANRISPPARFDERASEEKHGGAGFCHEIEGELPSAASLLLTLHLAAIKVLGLPRPRGMYKGT